MRNRDSAQPARRLTGTVGHASDGQRPVLVDRPLWIERHLPHVAVGVCEVARVSSPESSFGRLEDGRPRSCSLIQHRVHLGFGALIDGDSDTAESAVDATVGIIGQLLAAEQCERDAGKLIEDDAFGRQLGSPAQALLVGPSGPVEIPDAEGDQADALLDVCEATDRLPPGCRARLAPVVAAAGWRASPRTAT